MKRKIWTILFLVIVVCVSTGLLGAVYIHTDLMVRKNERVRIRRSVLEVFHIPYEEASIDKIFEQNIDMQTMGGKPLYRSRAGDVAFQIKGPGFWGSISAMIALEADLETMKGLKILENTETPGLGGRIAESWFQDQFKGKKLVPELKIVPYGEAEGSNEVDAITGATRTSKAFERIINSNIKILYQELRKCPLPASSVNLPDLWSLYSLPRLP
jgi:Na+-transporting NADH:ubiquinone oxidoreductase subunit C